MRGVQGHRKFRVRQRERRHDRVLVRGVRLLMLTRRLAARGIPTTPTLPTVARSGQFTGVADLTAEPMATAIAEARDEISRTDSKAGTLLTLATGALAGLLTFAHAHVPFAAAVALWGAAALTTAALGVLLTVVRPSLSGVPRTGVFPANESLLNGAVTDLPARQAGRLRTFSALAIRKHRRVRLAVDLLLGGLAALGVAVVLITAGGAL